MLKRTLKDYPLDLLLLADPDEEKVKKYIETCEVYTYKDLGVLVVERQGDTIEILNLAVKENMQKQGYGKEMLGMLIQKYTGTSLDTLVIKTADTSIHQLKLYKSFGFKEIEVKKNYFIEHYSEAIYENDLQCKDQIVLELKLEEVK